jgi:hypothetical protein
MPVYVLHWATETKHGTIISKEVFTSKSKADFRANDLRSLGYKVSVKKKAP